MAKIRLKPQNLQRTWYFRRIIATFKVYRCKSNSDEAAAGASMPTIREPSHPADPVNRLIFDALISSRSTVLWRGTVQFQSIRENPDSASSPRDYGDYDACKFSQYAGDGVLIETNRMIGLRCSPFQRSPRARAEIRLG